MSAVGTSLGIVPDRIGGFSRGSGCSIPVKLGVISNISGISTSSIKSPVRVRISIGWGKSIVPSQLVRFRVWSVMLPPKTGGVPISVFAVSMSSIITLTA